ncbi:MerR family transcriptional regulator [Photobacterium sp. SDRW27]|uniref:MerR family transcriptional regulator n=1 Tax=Photobacterium obscurum TaxID=2829490 RepID=UPI002242EE9D|nr:MerR family transcriptional regulator [Photobacterium obscurum]MCW8329353.1 MerR family transcriptional regulator [Photobacterium obscurum]
MGFETAFYTIKEVSEKTGINSVTLRAWQRRYGLLNPKRTEKGHRLYSDIDIEKIYDILSWLEKGVAIGKVRPLLEGRLSSESLDTEPEIRKTVELLLSALSELNGAKLDKLLIQIMKEYPLDVFIIQVVDQVENKIKHPENPLLNVQMSLWQSVMTERCIALIAQARKRLAKLCYLISFDSPNSYKMWLKAWLLTDKGYNVTVLPLLDGKLTGLGAALATLNISKLVVFGENRILPFNLSELESVLEGAKYDLEVSGSITSIHSDLITK